MAYKPTLADFEELDKAAASSPSVSMKSGGGYTPTAADFEELDAMNTPKEAPFTDRALGFVKDLGNQAVGLPASALTGFARGTGNLLNLPGNIINQIARRKVVPSIPQAQSFNSLLGVEENPLTESIASFIPSMLTAEASAPLTAASGLSRVFGSPISNQIVASGLYGASENKENPLAGSGEGALLGGAAGIGTQLAANALRPAAQYIAGKVVDPLTEKAAQLIGRSKPTESAAETLGSAYGAAKGKTAEWETVLNPLAKTADDMGGAFDNSLFVQKGTNLLEKYKPKIQAIPEKYMPAARALQDLIEKPPKSYQEAVIFNEKINDLPATWGETNQATQNVLKGISREMGAALKDQVNANSSRSPEAQAFAKEWATQRANYKQLKEFEKIPTREDNGVLKTKYKKGIAEKLGEAPDVDIIKEYVPRGSNESVLKMKHFSNLIGDQDKAKALLKNEYFKPSYAEDDLNTKKMLGLYKKLGEDQKKYMLNSQERDLFDSALKAKNINQQSALLKYFGNDLKDSSVSLGLAGLGGAIGGATSQQTHTGSPGEGAGIGAAVGAGIPLMLALMSKRYANPRGVAQLGNTEQAIKDWQRRLAYGGLSLADPALLGEKDNG